MAKKTKSETDNSVHNFFEKRKWLKIFACHYPFFDSGSWFAIKYILYSVIFMLLQFYIAAMYCMAAVLSYLSDDVFLTLRCLQMLCVLVCTIGGVLLRAYNDTVLRKTLQAFKDGVYKYEEVDESEYKKIKTARIEMMEWMTKWFRWYFYYITFPSYIIITPLFEYLKPHEGVQLLHPYLPNPMYMPWNSYTVLGFSAGFALNIFNLFSTVVVIVAMHETFLSCSIQIAAQFATLNHSLLTIHVRALSKLRKKKVTKEDEAAIEAMYHDRDYQDSLYACLRANAEHHQVILNLLKDMRNYFGIFFMMSVSVAALVLALSILFLLQNPDISIIALFSSSFVMEAAYHFTYCWCGDFVVQESGNVFTSLYGTPWFQCDMRFKRLILIMMAKAKTPTEIKALGFNLAASLETFGSIVSAAYSVTNVYRTQLKE